MTGNNRPEPTRAVRAKRGWASLVHRNRWTVGAIWTLIAGLILAGLATAVTSSLAKVHPEIVVETCSLLAAFLLVIVERMTARYASRRAVLEHVVQELVASTAKLCDPTWTMSRGQLEQELGETRTGLRFYYPQLSTSAVTAAILGNAFDSARDFKLVSGLQTWRGAAETCNSRLAMAQLLLFFLPASDDGMRERLRLHASIAAVPVVQTRAALSEISQALRGREARAILSPDAYGQLADITRRLENGAEHEYDTEELRALAQHGD